MIVWSDDYTGFYGYISAQGGFLGGDGGFVETSSRINLQAFGMGTVQSFFGEVGRWLLDPTNVTITAATTTDMSNEGPNPGGGATTPTGNIWYPIDNSVAATSQLSVATLNTLLGTGNVAVLTSGPLDRGEPGNITLNAGVTVSWISGNSLRLLADGNLILNGSISGGDSGTLELSSSSGGQATQGAASVISVGGLLLNNLGGNTLLNGANVVDRIGARSLSGAVSFRDTGGFNGATGLIISSVISGAVNGFVNNTSSQTTLGSTTANGINSSGTVNLTSVGPVTQTQRIDMGDGDLCVVTLNAIGQNILLTNPQNAVRTISMQTLNATGTAPVAANIRFVEESGFAVGQTANMGIVTAAGLASLRPGAITTARPLIPAPGGSVVLTGGASGDSLRANIS